MTELRVRIECGKQECGECAYIDKGLTAEYCKIFLTRAFRLCKQLKRKAGRPQRCAACRAAEVPAKGDEHASSH